MTAVCNPHLARAGSIVPTHVRRQKMHEYHHMNLESSCMGRTKLQVIFVLCIMVLGLQLQHSSSLDFSQTSVIISQCSFSIYLLKRLMLVLISHRLICVQKCNMWPSISRIISILDYIKSLQTYSALISRLTVLKSKPNSCIWSKYIIFLALYLGTLMLFWQKLKVSAIYRPVQKLTGIKSLSCANLMPFFFCNQGSKHTHTYFLYLLPRPWGCCSLPFLQGFTETRHFLTKCNVILKD